MNIEGVQAIGVGEAQSGSGSCQVNVYRATEEQSGADIPKALSISSNDGDIEVPISVLVIGELDTQ